MRTLALASRLILGMTLAVISMGAFQAAPVLVAYYKLDETAGNTAADSGPNAFTGTWTNTGYTAASAAGDFSPNTPNNVRSIVFTQPAAVTTNGGYVNVPDNATLSFTGAFSLMCWIKPAAYAVGQNPNNTGAIIQKWDWLATPGVLRGWALNLNQNGTIYFHTGTSAAQHFLTTTATVPFGAGWTHVAAVYDGANKFIYLNGVLSIQQATTLSPEDSAAALHLGKDDWARNYYGNLDEVRIFSGALSAAQVNAYYVGVPAPTGLTATAGINQVSLSWTAAAGAVSYNIHRAGSSGAYAGPPLASVTAPTVTFVDNTAANPNTYFYVVRTVIGGVESPNSNEVTASPLPAEVQATPNTGLQTNENGATTTFTIRFNNPAPAGGSAVTIVSNNPAEGTVSSPLGTSFTVPAGTTPSIVVTVTGMDDFIADGAVPYTVTVTASGFPGLTIPPVQLTNNDNDVAGITLSRTAGLGTSENLTTDTFTVSLNTQPTAPVTLTLSSSNPAEGTVSPGTVTFNTTSGGANGWNVAQVVTLTGVDDAALDFTVGYTIVTNPLASADGTYNNMAVPDVSAFNLDNEPIPALPQVWGGGGGGGCGLLGIEAVLLAGLAALRRRRRRAIWQAG